MQKVLDFLGKSMVHYFATVGIDGRPKVRPFQFMLEDGGKLYFCTSTDKKVFREMQANPYVEVCCSGKSFSWLRLSGRVRFSDELRIKEKIFAKSPVVKSIYGTPDHPLFTIFYLEEAVATIADFSGAPPETIELS